MTVLRHLASILLLPFVVVVVVPGWLLTSWAHLDTRWPEGYFLVWVAQGTGAVFLAGGLVLFVWCVVLFARVGKGTLAPWDPTERLVVVGPYRYVRNPMVSGVAFVLAGEAFLWGSVAIAAWLLLFVAANHVHFLLIEEPGLEKRFGEAFREYRRQVPRWVPRGLFARSSPPTDVDADEGGSAEHPTEPPLGRP